MTLLYHDHNIVPAIPAITSAIGSQYIIHMGALPVRGSCDIVGVVVPVAVDTPRPRVDVGVMPVDVPAVVGIGVEVDVRIGVAVG
jgi:hypothetical protein